MFERLLVASTKEFDFEAPVDGYHPFDEIDMLASKSEGPKRKTHVLSETQQWQLCADDICKNSRRRSFFEIESFLNPSGSRNLEYDEAVQPKPTVHE